MENEKEFHNWLEQFVKSSGHSFVDGFFFELKSGEVLYNGTEEYKKWYENKLKEWKKLKKQ